MTKYEEHIFKKLTPERVSKVLLDLCRKIEALSIDRDQLDIETEEFQLLLEYCNWLGDFKLNKNLQSIFRLRDQLKQQPSLQLIYNILVPLERELNLAVKDDFFITNEDRETSKGKSKPIIVVLDHLRSAFNVGSILRSCESFNIDRVCLVGYTPSPEDQQVQKTSMGTWEQVNWETFPSIEACFEKLKAEGYYIYGVETAEKAAKLGSIEIKFPATFVLGNERFGLSSDTLKKCDQVIEIELSGHKNSLNVANAASIVLYESSKQFVR